MSRCEERESEREREEAKEVYKDFSYKSKEESESSKLRRCSD